MEISKEKIINEISKTAFTDDENIKISDKLRALHLLNQIVKDNEKDQDNYIDTVDFIEDL